MKKDIHPKYYKNAKVHCACGNSFEVGSVKESLEIEICSQCHPFYTGQEKIVDVMGRVEKFKARAAKKEKFKTKTKRRIKTRKKKSISLKEIASESKKK